MRSGFGGSSRLLVQAAVLALSAGLLQAGIRDTAHDFSGESWSAGKVCLPCHASHGSSMQGYSWNHSYPPDSAFTTREDATLGYESLTCLGCHDGQTALDSFGGASGSTVMTGRAVVGRDLSNDHPAGVAYPTGDSRYKSAAIAGRDVRLFNGKVECASCHDAHNDSYGNFLRIDTRRLCQICHDL